MLAYNYLDIGEVLFQIVFEFKYGVIFGGEMSGIDKGYAKLFSALKIMIAAVGGNVGICAEKSDLFKM